MNGRIGASVKRLRNARRPKWTLDDLTQALKDMGVPISRDSLVNIEFARRDTVSLGEWFGLAAVFDVPPAALLAPDPLEPVTALPDRPPVPGVDLIKWITGEAQPWDLQSNPDGDPHAADLRYRRAAAPLDAHRRHDALVLDVLLATGDAAARHRAAVRLAEHRDAMDLAGWSLPGLDQDMAHVVAAVERSRATRSPAAPEPAPPTPTDDTANPEETRP